MLQRRCFHLGCVCENAHGHILGVWHIHQIPFRPLLHRYFNVFNAVVMTYITHKHIRSVALSHNELNVKVLLFLFSFFLSFTCTSSCVMCQPVWMTQTSLIKWIDVVLNKHHFILLKRVGEGGELVVFFIGMN